MLKGPVSLATALASDHLLSRGPRSRTLILVSVSDAGRPPCRAQSSVRNVALVAEGVIQILSLVRPGLA